MPIVQNIILPELSLQIPVNMYFRANRADFDESDSLESRAEWDSAGKKLLLSGDKKYYFNTYYNGLSVNVWKEHCRIERLSLRLRGRGAVRAELMLMSFCPAIGRSAPKVLVHRLLSQETVTLTPEGVCLPVEAWPSLNEGMLYVTLTAANAAEQAEFSGGAFETAAEPLRQVSLGIVVTHFNRKNYVLPAIKRLQKDILQHPYYGRLIDLAVIDNSRSITAAEAKGVTVLPNSNYGGAGGFSRGLLHFKDAKFSHCLFMDDDASCETESIYRTLALLQYAKNPLMAVSGAMLREYEPYRLWAKGEFYSRLNISCPKRGMDMRSSKDLLLAESDTVSPAKYGGFWHFAFPIAGVRHYPFPFFVRGDDILFGLVNPFQIITLNGIGNFADDFQAKEAPFIVYLWLRSNFTIEAIADALPVRAYIKRYRRSLRSQLYAYNYAHARACSLAAEDFMKGPDFWRENLDISQIRQKLAQQAGGEVTQRQPAPAQGQFRSAAKESPWRKLCRKMSWQGFLLPRFMIKRQTALIAKDCSGNPRAGFRRGTVFYYTESLDNGYYAEYDKKRFFAEWRLSWKIKLKMLLRLRSVIKAYQADWKDLASEKFWRKVYAAELQNAQPAAAEYAAAAEAIIVARAGNSVLPLPAVLAARAETLRTKVKEAENGC